MTAAGTRRTGHLGRVVAAGAERGAAAGQADRAEPRGPSTGDQRDPLAGPHRGAVARHPATLRTLGDRVLIVPQLATRRHLERRARQATARRGREGPDHLGCFGRLDRGSGASARCGCPSKGTISASRRAQTTTSSPMITAWAGPRRADQAAPGGRGRAAPAVAAGDRRPGRGRPAVRGRARDDPRAPHGSGAPAVVAAGNCSGDRGRRRCGTSCRALRRGGADGVGVFSPDGEPAGGEQLTPAGWALLAGVRRR